MERRSKIRYTYFIFIFSMKWYHVIFTYLLSGRTGSSSAAVHAVQTPLSWVQISAAFDAASARYIKESLCASLVGVGQLM
jgi:hypothetical protein